MKTLGKQFAICTQNEGYWASLELRKPYQILPYEKAANHKLIRVIDESCDDYFCPQDFILPIKLPDIAAKILELAA